MENEVKEIQQDIPEQIKVIKEEFERKLTEQKTEFEKVMKEKDKAHVEEIRALLSGKVTPTARSSEATTDEDEEQNMVNRITEKLKKRF